MTARDYAPEVHKFISFILLFHSIVTLLSFCSTEKNPIVSSKLKQCDCNQGTIQIQIRVSAFNSVFSNSCLKLMSHLPSKSRTEARIVSTKYFCNEIYLPKSHMNPTSCRRLITRNITYHVIHARIHVECC